MKWSFVKNSWWHTCSDRYKCGASNRVDLAWLLRMVEATSRLHMYLVIEDTLGLARFNHKINWPGWCHILGSGEWTGRGALILNMEGDQNLDESNQRYWNSGPERAMSINPSWRILWGVQYCWINSGVKVNRLTMMLSTCDYASKKLEPLRLKHSTAGYLHSNRAIKTDKPHNSRCQYCTDQG